jgi:hypothetical protein
LYNDMIPTVAVYMSFPAPSTILNSQGYAVNNESK